MSLSFALVHGTYPERLFAERNRLKPRLRQIDDELKQWCDGR